MCWVTGVHSRNRHLFIGNTPLAVAAAQTLPRNPEPDPTFTCACRPHAPTSIAFSRLHYT
jgi:hypothetical protein